MMSQTTQRQETLLQENIHHDTNRNFANNDPTAQIWPITENKRVIVKLNVKSLSVPRIDFQNVQEYDKAIDAFYNKYTDYIRRVVTSNMSFAPGPIRLTWTQRDLIKTGIYDFPELFVDGPFILLELTKGRGLTWCTAVNEKIATNVVASARSYSRTCLMYNLSLFSDENYITGLKNEMVSTFYENCDMINDVYYHNFYSIFDICGGVRRVHTMNEWESMLIAFYMGTHSRLGENSDIFLFNDDVLHSIFSALVPEKHIRQSALLPYFEHAFSL
jgi:hypothetical protein